MDVRQAPTTAWLIETYGQIVRPPGFAMRPRMCGCCGKHPLYSCGGVLLCACCDTDKAERSST